MPHKSIYDSLKFNYFISKCFFCLFVTVDFFELPVKSRTTILDCILFILGLVFYISSAYVSVGKMLVVHHASSIILDIGIYVSTAIGFYISIFYPIISFAFRQKLSQIVANLQDVDLKLEKLKIKQNYRNQHKVAICVLLVSIFLTVAMVALTAGFIMNEQSDNNEIRIQGFFHIFSTFVFVVFISNFISLMIAIRSRFSSINFCIRYGYKCCTL